VAVVWEKKEAPWLSISPFYLLKADQ